MSVTVELVDPRHDPEPADLAAFVAAEGLMPLWSYDLSGIASWNSWTPTLLGMVRSGSRLVTVICAVTLCPVVRGRFAPAGPGPVPRILDVRQPFNGHTHSWHVAAEVPETERADLFAAFERAAFRRLGPTCLGVVYRQATAADLPMLRRRGRVLRRLTRPAVPVMGTSVMNVAWSGVDGWLATLRKSRRGDLRRQVRRLAEDPDLVVRFDFGRTDVDTVAAARLLRAHHLRYNNGRIDRPQPTPSFLDRFVRRPDVGILTYTDRSGRLVGYGTLMWTGRFGAIIGQWAALRPEDGGHQHLYFDMYHRFVSRAIEDGRTTINAGRGMGEVKADLGFADEPMYTVVSPRWIT
jgi:hypothetical protein